MRHLIQRNKATSSGATLNCPGPLPKTCAMSDFHYHKLHSWVSGFTRTVRKQEPRRSHPRRRPSQDAAQAVGSVFSLGGFESRSSFTAGVLPHVPSKRRGIARVPPRHGSVKGFELQLTHSQGQLTHALDESHTVDHKMFASTTTRTLNHRSPATRFHRRVHTNDFVCSVGDGSNQHTRSSDHASNAQCT